MCIEQYPLVKSIGNACMQCLFIVSYIFVHASNMPVGGDNANPRLAILCLWSLIDECEQKQIVKKKTMGLSMTAVQATQGKMTPVAEPCVAITQVIAVGGSPCTPQQLDSFALAEVGFAHGVATAF